MLKALLAGAVAGGALFAAMAAVASRGRPLYVRAGAEEHQQSVLRSGARRLQEGRGGAQGRGQVPLHRPRRARRRRRGSADRRRPRSPRRSTASPSRPPTRRRWPTRCRARPAAKIPVLTWDSDLLPADKGERAAYVGTHNYEIGVNIAKLVMQIKPKGGTICIQSGGARGGQPQRAHAGHPRHARGREERGSARRCA